MSERAWCADCRTTREVTDAFEDDTGDSRVDVVVSWVMVLSCDHTIERETGRYRSPLQQAGLPRSATMPDPFEEEYE